MDQDSEDIGGVAVPLHPPSLINWLYQKLRGLSVSRSLVAASECFYH